MEELLIKLIKIHQVGDKCVHFNFDTKGLHVYVFDHFGHTAPEIINKTITNDKQANDLLVKLINLENTGL